MKNKIDISGLVLLTIVAAFVYIWLTSIIFAFRHPWMTSTERFLSVHKALMFKKVSYSDYRK